MDKKRKAQDKRDRRAERKSDPDPVLSNGHFRQAVDDEDDEAVPADMSEGQASPADP